MSEYFSIPAFLIMFREALEAAIIIAVLLQLLEKLKMPQYKKWVWFGALAGVGISVALGIVFVLLYHLANEKLLSGDANLIFKGCICWVASLMITYVAFHMLKFYNLERKWKHKLEAGFEKEVGAADEKKAAKSYKWSMFILAGAAALREGMESILFLTGVSAGGGIKAIIIPGIIGIIVGALCGLAIFWSGRGIKSLKWFFFISAGLLLLISAGMLVLGTSFFQTAKLFGPMFPYEYRPWSNLVLWDTTSCCNPDTNQFWALIRALFGYQAEPLNLQLLYYCLYWALAIGLLVYKIKAGSLTDYNEAKKAEAESFAKREGKFSATMSKIGASFKSFRSKKMDSTTDLEGGDSSPKNGSDKLDNDSASNVSDDVVAADNKVEADKVAN